MAESPRVFNHTRRYLHWAIVLLLLLQLPLAWIMVEQSLSPDKLRNYALHKSLGVLLAFLGLARITAVLLTRRPALPVSLANNERRLARGTQVILMLLLLGMPLTGWLMSSAANTPVSFFGLFTLPDLVAPDRARLESLRQAHRFQSYILLSLIGLHLLGAARHYFLLRNNVLFSMLPLRQLRRKSD